MMVSFNPAEAAVSIHAGLLPDTVRTFVFAKGTIGNTSFVAIPYNAAHKEGAMVVANFLLEPGDAGARAGHPPDGQFHRARSRQALGRRSARRFDALPRHPALPTNAELGTAAARSRIRRG